MSDFLLAIFAVLVAFVTTLVAVPLIGRVAVHRKLLDYPDGKRHLHSRPVPRLGGVAVFVGALVAVTVLGLLSGDKASLTPWSAPANRALFAASCVLFLIGLLDDLRGVRPVLKLAAQTVAAGLVVAWGFRIDVISVVPGYQMSLGVFAAPITVLWLVGVSNAYNLIDGLDGLAGGVGVIALAAIAASSTALGNDVVPLLSLALMGALLGFLRHNFSPARIFLGDSGSLVVGFLLAVFSVEGATRSDGVLFVLIPILALSYLLLDTGIAILRRWLRGAPLSRADGRHIHHRLLDLGLSPTKAVMIIYAKSLFVAVLALCVTFVPPAMTIAIATIGAAIFLFIMVYGVRWLDYHEFLEAGASLASALRKGRRAIQDRIVARDVERLIDGAVSVDHLSRILADHAGLFRFEHMDVCDRNDPRYDRSHQTAPTWRLDYPIASESRHSNGAAPMVLSIWCSLSPTTRAANAERVAGILAPAIGRALANVDSDIRFERPELTVEPSAVRHRRVSGSHRASDHEKSRAALRARQPLS